MNYILIMTEGNNELAFVNVLLEKGILKFKKEELLMEDVYHARQITGELMGYIQLLPSSDTVSIYRIGDKLSDKLIVPTNIMSEKIKDKYDISTTPEFEVLFLLNENLYDDYLKKEVCDLVKLVATSVNEATANIYVACKNDMLTAYGYHWKFINN